MTIKDLFTFIGSLLAFFLVFIALVVGLTWINSEWNCRSYPDAETKVIAASCYVKDGGKWVTFDSYIKVANAKVEIKK